ncbi:MAG TPA: hypothetical protein VFX45_06980 [Solirubrobacterales bacterium]|nr:hypothetical protein [Solirubrobacterales bacterium]
MFEKFSLKSALAGAAFLSAAALLLGFALDPRAFLGNLLAEVVGVLVSVLLAVLVVERIIERERLRRWDLVSEQTTLTLRFAIIRAGVHVYLRLPAPRDPDADPYTLGLLQDNLLTSALDRLATATRKQNLPGIADLVSLLSPQMQLIRSGVMPQLLAIGNHNLIARLAALESAFQDLEHTAWMTEQFGGLAQTPDDVAGLVEAMARVSEGIDEPGS